MVFELFLLAVAFVGSVAASIYDLKTTEVPDWIFYAMAAVGIPVLVAQAFVTNDFSILQVSTLSAVGLLAFGFLMYKTGQWGGADAALLALIAFLVPRIPEIFPARLILPFPVSFLINIFIVGVVYMLAYAIIFSYRQKNVFPKFFREIKASAKFLAVSSTSLFAALLLLSFYVNQAFFIELESIQIIKSAIVPVLIVLFWILVYKFSKTVERVGFRKKIPVSRLRIGDMLLSKTELVGITEEQLRRLKKSNRRFVWLKEGVRFVPTFPLALLATLYFGDLILLIRFLI